MDSFSSLLRKSAPALLIGVALSLLYLYFFAHRAHVEIRIKTFQPAATFLKVYWADEDSEFSEARTNRIRINDKRRIYRFFIDDFSDIKKIRIDPIDYVGRVKLLRLSLTQPGYEPIHLNSEADFSRLQIKGFDPPRYGGNGLHLTSTETDPQLTLEIDPVRESFFPLQHLMALIGIFAFVLTFQYLAGSVFNKLIFVPGAVVVILVLATTMASLTEHNIHPDESVHLAGVNYYGKHMLPPPIDSARAEGSFSIYGYSRLTSFEVYYQVAGYFTRILQPFKLSELMHARVFGLVMLALLLIFSFRYPDSRYFLLPLLVSAQAWYLFSYINSDGYALFIAILMSYQAAYRQSLLNRFLTENKPRYFWFKALGLGLFCGSLLLLKTNYYFFILFLGFYLLWRILQGEFPDQKKLWFRVILLALIGISLYGVRYGLNIAANGPNPAQKIEEQIEKNAKPLYKPSTELAKKHTYLYLKERGFTLKQMLHDSRWMGKTFVTAFGAYGYTQYLSGFVFYDLVKYCGLLILAVMLFGILINGPPSSHWLFVIALAAVLPLIASSFWHSWTVSFQPQGRYMMPILPVMGILYYEYRDILPRRLILALISGLFFLALYSFIFVGLHDVVKTA